MEDVQKDKEIIYEQNANTNKEKGNEKILELRSTQMKKILPEGLEGRFEQAKESNQSIRRQDNGNDQV